MNRNFRDIVDLVSRVSPEAGHILLEMTHLYDTTDYVLGSLMLWAGTPQGHKYWSDINRKILDKEFLPKDPKNNLTPVQRKCKKLWNQSNWVKAHPHMAY